MFAFWLFTCATSTSNPMFCSEMEISKVLEDEPCVQTSIRGFTARASEVVTSTMRYQDSDQIYAWKRFLIDDAVVLNGRDIKLRNYLITLQLTAVFSKRQFLADIRSDNFQVTLNYAPTGASAPEERTHAYISHMQRSEMLTGTDTMLLLEHILFLMGVHSVSLFNMARVKYLYLGYFQFISTMELRCMRGDTTDWYSNFGYFNQHRHEIEVRMRIVHNFPLHRTANETVRLGPFLWNMWMSSDKTEFHEYYSFCYHRFEGLLNLRAGEWKKDLNTTETRVSF